MVARGKIQKDPELQEYIGMIIDRMTYDATHQACVERFGEERVPSRSAIARYWRAKNNGHPPRPPFSTLGRDPELCAFIDTEKAGRTFEQLYDFCCEIFDASRVPSICTINRYWIRAHGRTRRKRGYKNLKNES